MNLALFAQRKRRLDLGKQNSEPNSLIVYLLKPDYMGKPLLSFFSELVKNDGSTEAISVYFSQQYFFALIIDFLMIIGLWGGLTGCRSGLCVLTRHTHDAVWEGATEPHGRASESPKRGCTRPFVGGKGTDGWMD